MIGMNGVPRIGITPYTDKDGNYYIPEGYVQGIERVGGEVVQINYDTPLHTILPLVASLDAMVFSGGVDVDPRHYGQKPEPECGKPNMMRDQLELCLFDVVMARYVPVLGICRGIEILNVAMGGTLVQDVPKRFNAIHQQPADNPSPFWHEVNIVPDTKLHALVGADKLLTNSYHHQCIDKLAPGLKATAYSQQGFVEAIELDSDSPQFFMAVQWHPEKTLDADDISIRFFEALRKAIH